MPARTCMHVHADVRTRLSGSTMMALSSSSDTSTQEVKDDLIMLMTRSLDRMSSFFTWSPVTLVLPAMPYLPDRGNQGSEEKEPSVLTRGGNLLIPCKPREMFCYFG